MNSQAFDVDPDNRPGDLDASDVGRLGATASVLAVVPHFACEQWLATCLSSLVSQSRPLDGIVVVDDASTTPPTDIVARFPGVTLLRATSNVGPYRLIQQVIESTNFDAYLFQDADDWSHPERLARLLDEAEHTGAELVGCDYVMVSCDRPGAAVQGFPADVNAALAAAPTAHALQHPTSLVARRLVQRIGGFASGMRFSGDAEFLRRAAHATKVVNVTAPLYFRRGRADSLTTSAATGHGSSARRAVLDALAERARANVAAVARGDLPRLEPFSTGDQVELEHITGPRLGSTPARPYVSVVDSPTPGADSPDGEVECISPIFVLSASPAIADVVVWSIGQHAEVEVVPDVGWVSPLVHGIDHAASVTGPGRAIPHTGRTISSLDAVGASTADLLSAVASAVSGVIGRSAWVSALPANRDDVEAALTLFPSAQVIHVVHRADDERLVDLSPSGAASAWIARIEACLLAESTVGPDRAMRVRFDDLVDEPEQTLRSCLGQVGLPDDERCAWLARSLEIGSVAAVGDDAARFADPDWRHALTIGDALCGPRPAGSSVGEVRLVAADASPSEEPNRRPTAAESRRTSEALLRVAIPPGAVVAAVTKGDDELIAIEHATAWHFPRLPDGRWAGYHPDSGDAAIDHLREVRQLGVNHFFVPGWAMWWLVYYDSFRQLLERSCRIVASSEQGGVLLELGEERAEGDRLDLLPLVPEDQRTALRAAPTTTRPPMPQLPPPAERRLGAVVASRPPTAPSSGRKPKVAVISWSVSHNPLGRAHLLADVLRRRYDVELLGASFDHFGEGIWPPLRGSSIPIRSFPGGSFPEHLWKMEEVASSLDADVLLVCKPRLPSLSLGILAKAARNRPMILDIDDHELTFVSADHGVPLDHIERHTASPAIENPFGRLWTQYCETLVPHADGVIVSNPSLQQVYGGAVIPHARDEAMFDPERYDRTALRREFGFAEDEQIVLFAGTPRRHKGIFEIVRALDEIGDPRKRLCLIATAEWAELRDELAPYSRWVSALPYQRFDDLPKLLAASDLVCVLQNPDDPVCSFQIPAKVTDALSMSVPCVVTPVAPLADVIRAGGVITHDRASLAETLAEVFADPARARETAARGRRYFLEHLSYQAVLPHLSRMIDELADQPQPMPTEFNRLVEFQRRRFGTRQRSTSSSPVSPLTPIASRSVAPMGGSPVARTRPHQPAGRRTDQAEVTYDVVMLWKQNDTGIYGRRHDMLLRELSRSPRIGAVVQFDSPVEAAFFDRQVRAGVPTHDALIDERTRARIHGVAGDPGVTQYTFVRSPGDDWRDRYADYVRSAIARHCSSERRLVLWAYPKNFELPQLIDTIAPDLVIADLVDDHRTWAKPGSDRWHEIDRHYAEVARLSDVMIANCAPVAKTMGRWGKPVHVVPNGCEFPIDLADPALADELVGLPRPLLGYVGNLSGRLDIELLRRLALEMPHASVVLVGSAHAGTDALVLDALPNVHFLGPRPYDEAKRLIAAFDVGLIPHLDDAMTTSMNPLKAFVYAALHIPVVSTAVANLDEMRGLMTVAPSHAAFVEAVRAAASGGRPTPSTERTRILETNSWTCRLTRILDLLDGAGTRDLTPLIVGGAR